MTPRLLSRSTVVSLVLVSSLLAADLHGRGGQVPQSQAPRFRLGIDIVQIDVTVLDADGKPVHGLLREDFTLLEDGEPQEILGFGEVNIPDASDGPAWLRDASPDADFEYRLPLPRLAPGLHLLRLEATAGASVIRRDVRFNVR